MSKNEKALRKDHCRAALYFEFRNALWLLGQEEMNKIYNQAVQDESDDARKK